MRDDPNSTNQTWPNQVLAFATSRAGFIATMVAIAVASGIVLLSVHRLDATDDHAFVNLIAFYGGSEPGFPSLINWIGWRYETWSGRILPEFLLWWLSPAPLVVWQIVGLVVGVGTPLLAVRLFDVTRREVSWGARSAVAIATFCILFLMDPTVVRWGAFWVTGAMNYWWIVPLALAAAIPAVSALIGLRTPGWWAIALGSLSAALAAVSNEQISAILVVLTLTATVWFFVRLRRTAERPTPRTITAILGPLVGAIIGAVILAAAPGNALRPLVDEEAWLPGFSDAPLSSRILGGIQFTVDGIVGHTGLVLVLVWILVLVIALRAERRSRAVIIAAITSLLALSVVVASAFLSLPRLTEFSASWGQRPEGAVGWAVLVVWLVLLIGTAASPLLLRRDIVGALQSLLIAASYAATFVISFSPSMYASGPRVFFVSNIAIGVVVLLLAPRALRGRSDAYTIGAATPLVLISALGAFAVMSMTVAP